MFYEKLVPARLFGRLFMAFLALLIIACLILSLFAPQVFVLAREGFPGALWPAVGDYARVEGAESAFDPPRGGDAPAASRASFDQQAGRALLVDNGERLQVEIYADGLDRDIRLNSYSMVKSLVGALVLRAIADGKIDNLDDKIAVYLGSDTPDASIREALTMTSGLKLGAHPEKPMEDGSFSPFGGLAQLHAFGLKKVLPELHVDPAQRGNFSYESVNTALLGQVLETVYSEPLPALLSRFIWKPAGAQTAYWRTYPAGDGVSAYCCLYARPLDWLKIGRFFLNNGTTDQAFLPEELWREFLMPELPAQDRRSGAYGFHIRHDILDREGEAAQGPFAYFFGHQGQLLYLFPSEDAVIVRFGEHAQLLHTTLYELFDGTAGKRMWN
ncbi:serine hydrolase domain-containing protein [Paracoccus alkanivorans]|uniref:Class C beta-lactamase-related serine hydrolase n=1 Tax=Paracoccus alkanivorans TaxID=2116655 RepID=A0A3M0M892_9RHOB|nr:serine hydrolase [Paracoccus alkanivorans]RMC33721.1 class C beta-lactamase-related serine hydrolase [Paracoccus alkanivorans]